MPLIKAKDNWWWRRARVFGLSALSLFVLGLALSPVERPIWDEVKATQPELNLREVEGALGQGLVIGLIGGFRAIIADFLFIKTNTYWENKDRPNTEAMLNLVTAVDPRPMFFWLNGARMMAYDMPAWEAQEMGGYANLPPAVEKNLKARYAELGMNFIDKAGSFHPNDYRVPLEKAQISINRLEDPAQAAKYYKEVVAMPDSPYYADRIYAEMLKRSGHQQEAYDYLRALYPTLPRDNAMAATNVVLERIRELEDELDLPPIQRLPTQDTEVRPAFTAPSENNGFNLGGSQSKEKTNVGPSYGLPTQDFPQESDSEHDHHDHEHDEHSH